MDRRPIPTYPELAGKTALLTGATSDIGAETARWLVRNGVAVAITGRNTNRLDRLRAELADQQAAIFARTADLTDAEAVKALVADAEEALGPIELLFAFAGAGGGRQAPIENTPEDQWRSVIEANLTATFLTVRAVLAGMKARGSGAIVTMASTSGRQPSRATPAYGAAKAGIILFTRDVAAEAGPAGVRANCIAPSAILTERTAQLMPAEVQRQVAESHPLRRLGTPADIAAAALFLASDGAGWITGQTLDIAGGKVMG